MRDLIELASEIQDLETRERITQSIHNWSERQPKRRGSFNTCLACGSRTLAKRNDVCRSCITDIVKSAIATDRATLSGGELLHVDSTNHWNNVPFLSSNAKVHPDQEFFRCGYDRQSESCSNVFENLVSELAQICLRGFPAPGPGQRTERLLGTNHCSSSVIQGCAPAGFSKAFKDLIFFVVWLSASAERDGFEEGSNLLTSLAAGTITNDQFTDRILKEGEVSNRKIEEAQARRFRR